MIDGHLTPTETKILQCAADGLDTKATAKELFISDKTVKAHRHSIFSKLSVDSMVHAVAIGLRTNLIT